MVRSPIKKARFGGQDLREFERLQLRLRIQDTLGADSKTLKKAVELANKHLDLKEKIGDLLKNYELGHLI